MSSVSRSVDTPSGPVEGVPLTPNREYVGAPFRPRVEVLAEEGVWTRVDGLTGEARGDGSVLCRADGLGKGFSESACRLDEENKDARRFLPFLLRQSALLAFPI